MRPTRMMSALALAWLVSRAALGWVTAHDDIGPYKGTTPAAHDITLYEFWADQADAGARPYVDFDLEYPPANLPFILGPRPVAEALSTSYETQFILGAIVVDGLAMAGLVLVARSHRRWFAPGVWLVLVPLLGPVALSRLDVVPAAALVWTVVLARRHRWARAGVALGLAAGTKVFAGLLAPIWLILAPKSARVRFTGGALLAALIPLLVVIDVPDQLFDDVWRYHSGRGIAMESTWGSLLLLGTSLSGRHAEIALRSGAWEILAPSVGSLKLAATAAVVTVVLAAIRTAWRGRNEPDHPVLVTGLSSAVVMLSVGLGNVLSVQYLVWCIAAVAIAAAVGLDVRVAAAFLACATVASHLVYPIWFFDLIVDQDTGRIAVLVIRNACILTAGMLTWRAATTERVTAIGSTRTVGAD